MITEGQPAMGESVKRWPCTLTDTSTDVGSSGQLWSSDDSSDLEGDIGEVVLLFDWDDTLLPTWYIKSVVEPCSLGASRLSPDSPFHEPLRMHAELVEETLRAARARGRVAIVTLSRRGWVFDSAAQFLPGLDLQQLVERLGISVYYAREHVFSSVARAATTQETVTDTLTRDSDVWECCKRSAMEKCLQSACRGRQVRLNVLSVGDSFVEQQAIQEVLWRPVRARLPSCEHLCKTIKLMEDPTLDDLAGQLKALISWLPEVVESQEDFDLDLSSVEGVHV